MVENIIFDFDGVILDSMEIRELGFRKIFAAYDDDKIGLLLQYHEANGGLSRYDKITYFYREILRETLSEARLQEMAKDFSDIMRQELTDKRYLIAQTARFLRDYHSHYRLHIASGSDQEELRYLCASLGLSEYFLSIHGSPTHKNILVEEILADNQYNKQKTILIGDSMNDYTAAHVNGIKFYGYNNTLLREVSQYYLHDYAVLEKERVYGTSL